jgi:hypothetical protein
MMPRDERDAPFKYELLEDQLYPNEIASLRVFAETQTATDNYIELYNRPDSWDTEGVIAKVNELFRAYIKDTFYLTGVLEPRLFKILKTDKAAGHTENYNTLDTRNEILYTATLSLNGAEDYNGGVTVFRKAGDSVSPAAGDIIICRQEELNSWEIVPTSSGSRLDVVLVLTELQKVADYKEFKMEQSIDDGVEY